MKNLSKEEFQRECKELQFRGKCAVLLRDNRLQNMHRVGLEYKDKKLSNLQQFKESIPEDISGALVNFEISSRFVFINVETIMNELLKYIPEDVNLIITATYNESKDVEHANITVILSTTQNTPNKILSKIESAIKPFKKTWNLHTKLKESKKQKNLNSRKKY